MTRAFADFGPQTGFLHRLGAALLPSSALEKAARISFALLSGLVGGVCGTAPLGMALYNYQDDSDYYVAFSCGALAAMLAAALYLLAMDKAARKLAEEGGSWSEKCGRLRSRGMFFGILCALASALAATLYPAFAERDGALVLTAGFFALIFGAAIGAAASSLIEPRLVEPPHGG